MILLSSVVEHAAVNRRGGGSSPTEGATKGCAAIYKGGGTLLFASEIDLFGPLAQLVRADGS